MSSEDQQDKSSWGIRSRGGKGTPTPRETTNTIEKQVLSQLSANERILNEIFDIYWNKEYGLTKIAKFIGSEVRGPRRKIIVLLLGNHSVGKSSFINWYIEESILKTGVAIETQGFSIVTSGKKRETLKGKATLQLYPYLKELQDFPGVIDFLSTEVSTSRAKKFNMVTFIDTPGLVDGDMHYPFDVNEALNWFGELADMILVFFDPMGQALCKRTLSIVEGLWASKSEKIRLYLAKADEAGNETDRQKVLMQIVQELCKRPGLNRTGFDMPTIFLPDPAIAKPTKCANQIEEVSTEIEKMINQTIQNSLNNLEKDNHNLHMKIVKRIQADYEARNRNFSRWIKNWCTGSIGVIIPVILFVSLIVANSTEEAMREHIGRFTSLTRTLMDPAAKLWKMVPPENHLIFVGVTVLISAFFLILSRFSPYEIVIPSRELKTLKKSLERVEGSSKQKEMLYSQYLKQSISETDYHE